MTGTNVEIEVQGQQQTLSVNMSDSVYLLFRQFVFVQQLVVYRLQI